MNQLIKIQNVCSDHRQLLQRRQHANVRVLPVHITPYYAQKVHFCFEYSIVKCGPEYMSYVHADSNNGILKTNK